MLRVRQLRFACVHPEEGGIESIDIIEDRARGNVRWIFAECGVVLEHKDGDAVAMRRRRRELHHALHVAERPSEPFMSRYGKEVGHSRLGLETGLVPASRIPFGKADALAPKRPAYFTNITSRLEALAPMSASSASVHFPRRSIVLANVCPPGFIAVEFAGLADAGELYPQERDEMTTFGEKRRSEFAAGRLSSKLALAEFGIVNFPLRINDDRRPRWPEGFVGSISHTHDYCAALVARTTDASAIGFDVERTGRIEEELWDVLFTPCEQERLRALPFARRAISATIVFSAKEAFYKCHFAFSPTWLDFTDVEIDVSPDAPGTVRTSFDIRPRSASVVRAKYVGRFIVAHGFVATSVVMPSNVG